MDCLFYVKCTRNDSGCFHEPEKELRPLFWNPSLKSSFPPLLKSPTFAVWSFMHFCRVFSNRDYGVFLIFHGVDLVHRSGAFPKYFRFPFMSKDDLQIGDTWTDPEYRGRGLAAYAMKKITHLQKVPGRRFWYVSERENTASIRAAENAGFVKFGEGVRTKKFGMGLFGRFEMIGNHPGDSALKNFAPYGSVKRLADVILSALGLLALSPVLFWLARCIRAEDRGPVFYRSVRVGLHGKLFRIFKFRTMLVDAEKLGASSTSDDDPRITRIGKFLRKYKLDELPQLINVLKGDMSFVGPRPQVKWAVDLYTEEEKALLSVRPGITDYASLRFPNEGEILKGSNDPDRDYMEKIHPEKMRLSLEYLRNRSFWLDMKLILQTVAAIFRH